MSEFAGKLVAQAQLMSVLEVVAVVLAIMYLVLAIRQNIWCWACAAASTIIFVYLFFDITLYMEAALNVFYLGMAIYGWNSWRSGASKPELPVSVWPLRTHVYAVSTIILVSVASGYLLDTRTDAAFPYVDSLTSWAAVWATFLVARKVLENWWYWLAIDATMVYVFWVKDLELTAVLYIVYLGMIPIGLYAWTQSYEANKQ
ncbi:MAG: nicotinamide riboside transporter PnuC [Woeseiaceae bacterium]